MRYGRGMKLRLFLASMMLIVSAAGAVAAMPSLRDVRAALDRAHFHYPMNRDEVTLRPMGEIRTDRREYSIVYYVRSENGGARHGAQRLLVFERAANSLRYLGQYSVTAAPVAVRGNKILFDNPNGNEITFGTDGPPRKAWIDGENPAFDTQP
jgi:hypothetical protein